MANESESGEKLAAALNEAWNAVAAIEPVRGSISAAQIVAIAGAIEGLAGIPAVRDAASGDAELAEALATLHGRAAAIAIAGGDLARAERWLAAAEALSPDDAQRAELAAARLSHERYRQLIHGRCLAATRRQPAARAIWTQLASTSDDGIARAAAEELKVPRSLGRDVSLPTLHRINGFGVGFYGERDPRPDGSHVTTHCISALWIPIIALSAWRVRFVEGGYQILSREPLSPFARKARWAVPIVATLAIVGGIIVSERTDPKYLARQRWDEAIAVAQHSAPEQALQRLDAELARDLALVDNDRAARAGAEVVRLSAGYVASPLTADKVDQAIRVVRRYQTLPPIARDGATDAAMFALVDRWLHQLEVERAAMEGEARLALASAAYEVAPPSHKAKLRAELFSTRLMLASAKQVDAPLEALALLVGASGPPYDRSLIEMADEIALRLAAAPSLLLDAGSELDIWIAATRNLELRDRIPKLRDDAAAGRKEAEAEGTTAEQLAQMALLRPWDQYVAIQLASTEAAGDKLDAAAARLGKLGPPGMMVRRARFVLAQIAAAQGKLDDADAQLSALLGTRVQQFAAASAAVSDAANAARERIEGALRLGNVPEQLKRRWGLASETERDEIVTSWMNEQMANDPALTRARAAYAELDDVVPMALAAGSIKLRRSQALTGPARARMLEDAERTYLAIRSEAEGQPAFRLSLGEIYARLGKTAESEAELAAVLANHDLELDIRVSQVYRNLGSTARAKEILRQVYDKASSPLKEATASSLGVLYADDEDEAERWYRKSDQSRALVRAALLGFEARRLERDGKPAACAAKYAAAAKLELATANLDHGAGYNNAAVYSEQGFDCSGDLQLLRDAEAALQKAYRSVSENATVVANLRQLLINIGNVRVLGRHIDVRALHLQLGDITTVVGELVEGPERDALLAELTADPSIRRSRELLAEIEVLAPNDAGPYQSRFEEAVRKRDVDAAAAVLDRIRRAKALDVRDAESARERTRSGVADAKHLAILQATRSRLEPVLATPGADRLSRKTRAAGWYLLAHAQAAIAVMTGDAASAVRAREAATTAGSLWPGLDTAALCISALIDEAGLGIDPKAWTKLRRFHAAVAALDGLAGAHDALAARILASQPWTQVASHVAIDPAHPTLAQLRLARLLGDPAMEARARPALDDKLIRLGLELDRLVDPGDEDAQRDLAYLDKR